MSRQKQLDLVAEHILLVTGAKTIRAHAGVTQLAGPPNPLRWKRIIPIAEGLYDDDFTIPTGTAKDIDRLDIAITSVGAVDDAVCLVHRFRSVAASELRGRVRIFPRYAVDHVRAYYDKDGSVEVIRALMGSNDGKAWTSISNLVKPDKQVDDEIRKTIELAYGMQFQMHYFWGIELGLEGSKATVLLPTDPSGIRAMLKDRDIEADRDRRRALRHWVTDHMRKKRDDAEAEVYVREHLRGTTEFSWHGMIGRIHPSREVVLRVEAAKATSPAA